MVLHLYNPLSCFRCTEMMIIFGMPDLMKNLNKYVNPIFGHTHYGIKSSMYDCYKMRHIPVYSIGLKFRSYVSELGNVWGGFVAIMDFLICLFLRYLQFVYIYTVDCFLIRLQLLYCV